MGWSFVCDTSYGKADLVKELKNEGRSRFWNEGVKIIATSVVGNNCWQVLETDAGERVISLTLMQSGYPTEGWGYKVLEESCGPCEVNCPLSFLDMAPVPKSEFAVGWRDKVREHHAQAKKKGSLKEGDFVKVYGRPFRLVSKRTRGWNVVTLDGGQRYRVAKGYVPITEAEARAMEEAAKSEAKAA